MTRTPDGGGGGGGDPAVLAGTAVVLDHPKDVVNIAGVVRVMLNFGLRDLRLVAPDDFDPYRIEGIAHRSRELIDATRIFPSLREALADRTLVVGTTARSRTAGRNYVRPREAARTITSQAPEGGAALLFGREDRGLDNEALDLCRAVAVIPTDPAYSSLNLAQACLVLAYELFLVAGEAEGFSRGRRATRPPTVEEVEQAFAALRGGLERIEFFKARRPEAVLRTLRTIVARGQPDLRETRLLAAIGYEIGHYIDRIAPTPSAASSPGDSPDGSNADETSRNVSAAPGDTEEGAGEA